MKKLSYLLNVLLIGFIGFQSFKQKDVKDKTPAACTPICIDYTGVGRFKMNSNVLKMMSANYVYGNGPVSHNTINDAKSVWLSLTALKTFIWQIESKVCTESQNCAKKDSLGIRIYYSRYPRNVPSPYSNSPMLWNQYPNDLRNLPSNYQKEHTFFMLPTFDINGVHVDFDPYNTTYNTNCKPTPLTQAIGPCNWNPECVNIPSTRPWSFISALTPDPAPTAKNHGELCPPYPNGVPPCPGAYFQ